MHCITILHHRRCCVSRAQSERFGTQIFSETVTKVDLSRRPFKVWTDRKSVEADTVIVATGAQGTHCHFSCPAFSMRQPKGAHYLARHVPVLF